MTFEEFSKVFAVLAIQLRANDVDATTAKVYYNTLKDVDAALIQLAAGTLARTAQFFPKTSEWLDETTRIESERRLKQGDAIRQLHRMGRELCIGCGDTGWKRDETTNRVARCECQDLRRLEILGRRPLPALNA